MKQLMAHAGDAQSAPAGNLSVNVIYIGYGAGNHTYRVTVTHPGFVPQPYNDRADDRSMGHPDHQEAQALAEHYAASVAQVLTVEQDGIPDEQIAAVADGINADLDAAHTARVNAYEAEQADVAAIMATSRGFRGDRTSTAAPTSDPMDRIVAEAAHAGGRIVRSKEATSTQLIALDKRGLVELVYGKRGSTRVITGARLTTKGFKHAGVDAKAVAA